MSVFVTSATSSALVDIGEQRSPKKLPDRMAPPSSAGSVPIPPPIIMQITPTVAAVPREVPVRTDTSAHSRKEARSSSDGENSRMA